MMDNEYILGGHFRDSEHQMTFFNQVVFFSILLFIYPADFYRETESMFIIILTALINVAFSTTGKIRYGSSKNGFIIEVKSRLKNYIKEIKEGKK